MKDINERIDLGMECTEVRVNYTYKRGGQLGIDIEDVDADALLETLRDKLGSAAILDWIGRDVAIEHFGITEAE